MSMKFTIGRATTSLSIEGIRERYADKSAFVSGMLASHGGMFDEKEEKVFKRILEKAWKEAFPEKEETPEGAFQGEETNGEAPQ
jgi:hypothetical protein